MKKQGVIQGVLWWDEIIAKCNKDSKRCRQLMSEIMEIIDERETQKQKTKTKYKKHTQKRTRGTEATVKAWELNDFVLHLS